MYSYEDRIRAVEPYIKLGKRVRATIRQLGYSCFRYASLKLSPSHTSTRLPAATNCW
jgi:hypothetical protein